MKRKLFTLLTLLLTVCSGAWADDYTDIYTNPASGSGLAGNASGMGAFTEIGNFTGDVSLGNSSLQIGTKGGSGTFTISTIDGSTITGITFTQNASYPVGSLTSDDGVITQESNVFTFSPNSNKSSAVFTMSALSGNKVRVAPIAVSLTSDCEYFTMNFSISEGTISCTKSNGSSDVTLTTTGSVSGNRLSVGKEKTLTITSAGHNIKAVHFTFTSHADVSLAASTGSYNSNTWTAGDDTQTVTFTSSGSSVIGALSVELDEISMDPSISADNVNIGASATGGSITYSVSNPIEGGVLTADKLGEADWLTTVGTPADGSISLTTTQNTGAIRNATIRLTYTYNTSETVTKDVTVTQAAPTYAITYNPGANGTGSIANGEKEYNVAFTLSATTFTRDGYVQTGWATSDGGAKAYELGESYTTDADLILYPVWEKANVITAFNYSEGKTISQLEAAGWTFHSAGISEPTDSKEYVDLVSSMNIAGVTTPKLNSMEDNAIAFAKNPEAYAMFDLGEAKTIVGMTATLYGGSSSGFNQIIQYVGADGITVKKEYTNNLNAGNWKANSINKTDKCPDVRYIKLFGATKWVVMTSLLVSTEYDELIPVSTLAGRNYGTMVTPAGKKLDFAAVAEDITAYIATGFNGAKNAIVLQSVDVVDAATPIIVKTATQGATVNVPVTTADASSTTGNALVAGDGTTAWNGTDGYTYYYIASDQFHKATSGTLQSGKAYLKVANGDVPAEARAFGFVFEDEGEVTGISATLNDKAEMINDNSFYNLNGQRIAQPSRGLYIVNGRKVIIR